jgi:hypothetical protein
MPTSTWLTLLTALLTTLSCGGGVAGFAVSSLIARQVGSDLIDDARSAGAQLIAEGGETANASIIRAGNEILVAADAATRIAGSEVGRTVDRMSEQNRRLLQGLHDLTNRAAGLSRDAFRFKDAAILDLRAMFVSVPLVGETFYVQRIDGVTQIAQESDYRIEVMGVGLGPDSEKSRSEIRISINGQAVPNVRIQRVAAHTATIWIPSATMQPLVMDKSVALVSVKLDVRRRTREGFWLWKKWRSAIYSVPFTIALYSRYAAVATVESTRPLYGWVSTGEERATRATANHHCPSDCRGEPTRTGYSATIKVASTLLVPPTVNDRRLRNPKLRCIAGQCGGWFEVKSVYLSEGDSRATGNWDVWSRPSTWELTASVENYQFVGEEKIRGTIDLYYGGVATVEVPVDATFVKVTGQLIAKQRFELVIGEVADGPIRVTSDTKGQPGQRRITFRVDGPE